MALQGRPPNYLGFLPDKTRFSMMVRNGRQGSVLASFEHPEAGYTPQCGGEESGGEDKLLDLV